MKQYLFAAALTGFHFICFSQTKVADYGKVDKQELQMTACSFEKDAPAMYLFNEAESFFKIDYNAVASPFFEQTEHHTRIKIFNKKGFEFANIKIRYRNSVDILIKDFKAQTYNLDAAGNIVTTKVEKSIVFDKEINKRYRERTFAFPDVKEGSVIEYSYTLSGASEGTWYFQKSIPVAFSRFIVNFPDEMRMSAIPYCNLPLQRETKGTASYYSMQNIPGLADEPYMSCREDYLQRMDAELTSISLPNSGTQSLLRTWPQVVKSMLDDEDFGKQLKRHSRTSDLDKMLEGVNDPLQKMKIIHNYVRSNMEWNGVENIWALDGVKSAWKSKKGTSGEINLILINLLRDAGLHVAPILVSTRDNGIINTGFAGYDQFNKVMAHVEIGNKTYVLDATEKNTPSHIIPLSVMASEGLLINKPESAEWGWKTIWDPKTTFNTNVSYTADIDEKGIMTGTATVTSADYDKLELLDTYKKGKEELQKSYKSDGILSIDSFTVAGADNDTLPLTQDFKFTASTNSSGEYHYFSANYFAGLNKNPFVADERSTDVFYGANQHYVITGLVFLPDGYSMEELPKNLTLITSDTNVVFKRRSVFNDGFLDVTYSLDFKKPSFANSTYPELKEFFKKVYEMLNEKFVYKKKK